MDRVADCFVAASRTRVPFWFFFSFDMSSIPSETKDDVHLLCSYLENFGQSERMLHYAHGLLVSTFAGERSSFQQPTLDSAWSFVKERLSSAIQSPIHYVPSLFIDPELYSKMKSLDGAFNWNGSWPLHLDSDSPRREIECPVLETDMNHITKPQRTWNKNWIYRGDDWLFVRRWEQLIAMRDQIDIVQIISWNDYGESHYIGPIKGAQPNSQAWVDGYPHDAWLKLTAYFSRAFKEGQYPLIDKDQIFAWARPHPRNAVATNDPVPRPNHANLTDDKLWVVVFAKTAATISMYGKGDVKVVDVRAGFTKLFRSLEPGDGIKVEMERNGIIVAECSPVEFKFEARPLVYNFNAFVTCS
ncbi:glycoside hydrolase family 71 protein [Gymnopus androsaceus JB14]|uniref:Glycoside hydrolase family 71 protein n=1 Tax=Gymnopus androsaceus JB14 TaxID=1447944 RepID=A0A6A4I9E9_9AGAR|nr:glycoside hydrolase family 71 protein [Gymnopus androsaceus JB14]